MTIGIDSFIVFETIAGYDSHTSPAIIHLLDPLPLYKTHLVVLLYVYHEQKKSALCRFPLSSDFLIFDETPGNESARLEHHLTSITTMLLEG